MQIKLFTNNFRIKEFGNDLEKLADPDSKTS